MNQPDKEIIEKLLSGWTLKMILESEALETNGGRRLENIALGGIFVKDYIFWAYSSHHHLALSSTDYNLPEGKLIRGTFLFSNFGQSRFLSCISEHMDSHHMVQELLPLSRYKLNRWLLIENFEEIYNSSHSKNVEPVKDAIRNNDNLKCAFLDQDCYWHICNIHIPYFIYAEGKIYFQTEPFKFQPAFLSEQWIDRTEKEGESMLHQLLNRGTILGGGAYVEGPISHAQYVIDLDGRFTDMASQRNRTWLEAREIRIFREQLPIGVEQMIY